MIYPAIGISMFTHIVIIGAVKTKEFFNKIRGLAAPKKKVLKKPGLIQKVLLSFLIAATIETVALITIISSVAAFDAAVTSKNSNYHLLINAYSAVETRVQLSECPFSKVCFQFKKNLPDAKNFVSFQDNVKASGW